MKFIYAIFLLILTALSILQGWSLLSVLAILTFSFYYSTAYLVILAIVLDGYMGTFYTWPMLSIVAVVWFLLVEFMRPRFIEFKKV